MILKTFYSPNLLCICPSLFETNLINIACTKNSQELLASQVPVLKRNKATNSRASNHPFFSCSETVKSLAFVNLFEDPEKEGGRGGGCRISFPSAIL